MVFSVGHTQSMWPSDLLRISDASHEYMLGAEERAVFNAWVEDVHQAIADAKKSGATTVTIHDPGLDIPIDRYLACLGVKERVSLVVFFSEERERESERQIDETWHEG